MHNFLCSYVNLHFALLGDETVSFFGSEFILIKATNLVVFLPVNYFSYIDLLLFGFSFQNHRFFHLINTFPVESKNKEKDYTIIFYFFTIL